MTKEKLKELAKKANVKLEHVDSVYSFLNDKGTFIITLFYLTEVCGGRKQYVLMGETKTRFFDILKREEYDDDYYTKGTQWLSDIK